MVCGICDYGGDKCFEDKRSKTIATVDCAGCDYLILTDNPQTEQAEASSLSDLLGCPFCGAKAELETEAEENYRAVCYVSCTGCCCRTDSEKYANGPNEEIENRAKKAWNTRAI